MREIENARERERGFFVESNRTRHKLCILLPAPKNKTQEKAFQHSSDLKEIFCPAHLPTHNLPN